MTLIHPKSTATTTLTDLSKRSSPRGPVSARRGLGERGSGCGDRERADLEVLIVPIGRADLEAVTEVSDGAFGRHVAVLFQPGDHGQDVHAPRLLAAAGQLPD